MSQQDPITSASRPSGEMLAAVLDRFGGVDELSVRRVPIPTVGDNDVLIRVEFAGVGSWDAEEREGLYDGIFGMESTFPYILGWDGAGIVAATGSNVESFSVGDQVYAAAMPLPRGGLYAQYAVVQAEHVAHKPQAFPGNQAGALAWDALTALSGLDTLALKPGESLMIFGASGGIGHMAVQFAKRMGVRVFAVASGDDGVALARDLGAEHAIDGRRDDVVAAAHDFAPQGLDAALVTVGGEATNRALNAMAENGRVAYPQGVQPIPKVAGNTQLLSYDGDRSRSSTDRLNALIESGQFKVHIAQTFALNDIKQAHQMLKTHYLGKVALQLP